MGHLSLSQKTKYGLLSQGKARLINQTCNKNICQDNGVEKYFSIKLDDPSRYFKARQVRVSDSCGKTLAESHCLRIP